MVYPCLVDMGVEFGFEWIPTSGEHNCHKGLFVYWFMLFCRAPGIYLPIIYESIIAS